jgi:hypothetical protein
MVVPMRGQAMQLIPVHGETAGHACRTKGSSRFIGKLGTTMIGAAIRDVSGAAILRWAPPGTMLTMDYRADRVTVYLDGRKKITRITCG